MSRRKKPAIPNELLDQLLAGGAASAAFEQGGLLDSLKKALTEPRSRQQRLLPSRLSP
jgi:putative transposase